MYIYIYISCIHIYIYIYRERERDLYCTLHEPRAGPAESWCWFILVCFGFDTLVVFSISFIGFGFGLYHCYVLVLLYIVVFLDYCYSCVINMPFLIFAGPAES